MSHALRAAIAATSLFGCPACVTPGSFSRNIAETIASGSSSRTASSDTGNGPPTPIAVRAESPPFGKTSAVASGPTPADGTAAILAWERTRPGASETRVTQGLTFEPADSRIRLVMTLMNPAALVRGIAEIATEPTPGVEVSQADLDAYWAFAPGTDWGEEPGPEPQLVALGAPPTPGLSDPIVPAPATHPSPEPGTLALATLGLAAVGWQYRRRLTRVIHSSG